MIKILLVALLVLVGCELQQYTVEACEKACGKGNVKSLSAGCEQSCVCKK